MDDKMYTELKLNIKYTDDSYPNEFVARIPDDGVDMDMLFNMFEGLVVSAGFQVGSFNDCIKRRAEYLAKNEDE